MQRVGRPLQASESDRLDRLDRRLIGHMGGDFKAGGFAYARRRLVEAFKPTVLCKEMESQLRGGAP
jgi:hypothetical protein